MLVIMLQRWASPHGSAEPGQEIDLPAERARKLIEAKAARAVEQAQVRTRPAAPASSRSKSGRGKTVSTQDPAG